MKKIIVIMLLVVCSMVFLNNAFAHSGRTDRRGGHHNWKSGYGTYHYHGGY